MATQPLLPPLGSRTGGRRRGIGRVEPLRNQACPAASTDSRVLPRINVQRDLPPASHGAAATQSPVPLPTAPDQTAPAAEEQILTLRLPRKTMLDWIQSFIWRLWNFEEGAGGRIFKLSSALIGFILLALWFNLHPGHGFSSRETMESAQMGRHLAAWAGYTTDSIRPSAIGLLQRAAPDGAPEVLDQPVPDLSIAPGYPFVLAGLMKVFPFNFAVNRSHLWSYQPELLIVIFNELLFFAAVLVLFQVARGLFDTGVAWVSAILFAGSETYWRFSLSGLSTMWLLLIFLLLVWCLVAMEGRENRESPPAPGPSLALAAAGGRAGGDRRIEPILLCVDDDSGPFVHLLLFQAPSGKTVPVGGLFIPGRHGALDCAQSGAEPHPLWHRGLRAPGKHAPI